MVSQRHQGGKGVMSAITCLDAFPKVPTDFMQQTASGGVISLAAYCFMLLLFLTETRLYMTPQRTHELVVDSTVGATINIDFDIAFPRMPCAWLSLDAMDVSGELHLDVHHDVYKQRLSPSGTALSQAERHHLARSPEANTTSPAAAALPAAVAAGNDTAGAGGNGTAAACGNCYGAEDGDHPCCATCDDVRDAYQRRGWVMLKLSDVAQCVDNSYLDSLKAQEGEGCRMYGGLAVNRVAGNFHFAAGRSFQQGSVHVHDVAPFAGKALDFSHAIARLSFGPQYPGMANPLEGVTARPPPAAAPHAALAHGAGKRGPPGGGPSGAGLKDTQSAAHGKGGAGAASTGMMQYFLKVVPTVYVGPSNKTLVSNQYSVTEHFRESAPATGTAASRAGANPRTLPGVFFFYDLSPIKVHIVEGRASFLHYLTNLCAIVGGVFAVSGLLDGAVHQGERIIRTKMQMGKFS
ncbi:MAG: endoplasmic reticulum vesicle transporter-domain-containing protein [Monoraphidium minutum]|nr:MAG: endoplasmic reticulum vesicle transporter-domain-containing protein [Monoraphidium minutum]